MVRRATAGAWHRVLWHRVLRSELRLPAEAVPPGLDRSRGAEVDGAVAEVFLRQRVQERDGGVLRVVAGCSLAAQSEGHDSAALEASVGFEGQRQQRAQ